MIYVLFNREMRLLNSAIGLSDLRNPDPVPLNAILSDCRQRIFNDRVNMPSSLIHFTLVGTLVSNMKYSLKIPGKIGFLKSCLAFPSN